MVRAVTLFVFSHRKGVAEVWAHGQGYQPRDVVAYGDHSNWHGLRRFQPGDRVVILGPISGQARAVGERLHLTSPPGRPNIELVMPPVPA